MSHSGDPAGMVKNNGLSEESFGAVRDAAQELARIRSGYKTFASCHEGYAVLLEEVDELWEEIRIKDNERDYSALYTEAIQVAAVAMRLAAEWGKGRCG